MEHAKNKMKTQNLKMKNHSKFQSNKNDSNNDLSKKTSQPNRESLLDVQTTQYYQRVLSMLNKDFEDEEEREMFMTNIVNELKGNVFKISQTKIGGSLMEKVLPHVDILNFCDLLEALSKDWEVVCASKSASFVVQAFVRLARHHFLDEAINSNNDTPDLFKSQQERLFALLTAGLGDYLASNLAFHMQHSSVSHVIRGLFELLSTRRMDEGIVFGRKTVPSKNDAQKTKMDGWYKKEVRRSYKKRMSAFLVKISRLVCVLPKLEDHALNTLSGPVIQVLIESLAVVDTEESKMEIEKLIKSLKMFADDDDEDDEEEDAGDDNDGPVASKSKLSTLILHPCGSRMVEPILRNVSDPAFDAIFHKFFKDHLVLLACHHIGNFVLQALITSLRTPLQFEALYSELRDHLESLLASDHTAVLIKLLEAAVKLHCCQELLLQDLLKSFHCHHDVTTFVRLLLLMVTHETLYAKEAGDDNDGEKGVGGDDNDGEKGVGVGGDDNDGEKGVGGDDNDGEKGVGGDDDDEKLENKIKSKKKKKRVKDGDDEEEDVSPDNDGDSNNNNNNNNKNSNNNTNDNNNNISNNSNNNNNNDKNSKHKSIDGKQAVLENINRQGSLILQHLLRMADPSTVLHSLRALTQHEVETVACDASGCRVVEALFGSESVSVEEKRWYVKAFKNKYVRLSCSKFGSRSFDAIWEFADEKRKNYIRNELKVHTEKIRSDKFGYFVFLKCGLNERKRKKEKNNCANSKNNKNKKNC